MRYFVKCLIFFKVHRNYVETVVDNISYVHDDKYFYFVNYLSKHSHRELVYYVQLTID